MTLIFKPAELDQIVNNFMSKFQNEYIEAVAKIEKKTHDPILFAIDFSFVGKQFDWKSVAIQQAVKQKRTEAIGHLHEDLINLMPGWTKLKQSGGAPDLVCKDKKIIVECKARSDTTKGDSLASIYDNLRRNIEETKYSGFTALYAHILNKNKGSFSKPKLFTPSDNKQKHIDLTLDSGGRPYKKRRKENSQILEVDGSVLWSIVIDPNQGINPPYSRPDAIIKVYEEVIRSILKFNKKGADPAALKVLKAIAIQNFQTPTKAKSKLVKKK